MWNVPGFFVTFRLNIVAIKLEQKHKLKVFKQSFKTNDDTVKV